MSRRLLTFVFWSAVSAGWPLVAHAQAPAPAATGEISGVLTSADRGLPVRKAPMRLVSTAPRLTRNAVTDGEGRFVFVGLPAGEYTLSATKPGYLEFVYGARRPGYTSPGTSITLAAGQKIEKIDMRLPRGSVITGIVTDEFGDPAFNAPVRAMRFTYTNGERIVRIVGTAVTDDLGSYRIAGLSPGEYLVSVVPRDSVATLSAQANAMRQRTAQMEAQALATGDQKMLAAARADAARMGPPPPPPPTVGYTPIYFPGTPQAGGGGTVRVGPTEEVRGIDIKLQVLETATVTGVVTNAEGDLPGDTRVQLIDPRLPVSDIGVWFRNTTPDGRFSFHGVVPGSYVLKSQAAMPTGEPPTGAIQYRVSNEVTAAREISVAAGSTEEFGLTLRRGVAVSGALALETITSPFEVSRMTVDLRPVMSSADWEMGMARVTPDAEGKFSMRDVVPHRYRVVVSGLPDGWGVATAVFDGKDAADLHLDVEQDGTYTGGVIKFTNRTGELAGLVSRANGTPAPDHAVVLFPSDRRQWLPESRRIHAAQPGADGRYTIRNLPPGEYRVGAILDLEPGRQFNPDFLAEIFGASTVVTIGESDKKTQNLIVK